MNEEKQRETDSNPTCAPVRRASSWPSTTDLSMLEQLFPDWVICRSVDEHRRHFLSRNSAAFFGISPDELATKTCDGFIDLIHPDDVDPYQRSLQKVREILKGIAPTDVFQYRFMIQYRLRRRRDYLSLHEEQLFHHDEHDSLIHFTLFRDMSAERSVTRVQLDWYRVHEVGYQRIGSYVPAAVEQDLTAREVEVIQLIKEGLSSKEIADRLYISVNTVRNHRSNLFRKTNARNMVDLVKATTQAHLAN